MVMPDRFIPVAEGNRPGRADRPVGAGQACRQLARWDAEASAPIRMAVMAAPQLRQPVFVGSVRGTLQRTGLAPGPAGDRGHRASPRQGTNGITSPRGPRRPGRQVVAGRLQHRLRKPVYLRNPASTRKIDRSRRLHPQRGGHQADPGHPQHRPRSALQTVAEGLNREAWT